MSEKLKLEAFLPYRLNVLATKVSQALAARYESAYGLSIPEWRVLATLGQYGSVSAKEIAYHSQMDKIKVSRAVARLVDRGFLSRGRNSSDRRMKDLTLSEKGHAVYLEIVPEARAYEEALLEGMGKKDFDALDRLILRLTEKAERL